MSDLPADLKPHEPSKQDVEVFVPERRQYGIVQGPGLQVVYTSREVSGGRFSIMVHPDHVNRVLRAIEGSKPAKGSASVPAEQLPIVTRSGVVPMDPAAAPPVTEPSVKVAKNRR